MIEIGGTPIINAGGYGGYAGGFDGGMGGNWIWAFLLFALLGNGGFGGNRLGATEGDIYKSQQFQNIDNGLRSLGDGQCQLGFQLTNTIKDGDYSTSRQLDAINTNFNNSVCTIGYQNLQNTSQIMDKISSCCCDNLRGQDAINYNVTTQAERIMKNQDSNTNAILAWLNNDRADRQAKENSELRQKIQTMEIINSQKCVQYNPCGQPVFA